MHCEEQNLIHTNLFISDSLTSLTAGTYYLETTDLICGNHTDTIIINEPSQTTSIEDLALTNEPKVWLNNNKLLIEGNNISNVTVRNLLGQILFTSSKNKMEKQVFNLEQLSSQILMVTTLSNNKGSSYKVVFVNTND